MQNVRKKLTNNVVMDAMNNIPQGFYKKRTSQFKRLCMFVCMYVYVRKKKKVSSVLSRNYYLKKIFNLNGFFFL